MLTCLVYVNCYNSISYIYIYKSKLLWFIFMHAMDFVLN